MEGEDSLASQDLHGVVHDPLCGLGSKELGHRRLERHPLRAPVGLTGGPVDEQPGGGQVGRHARQLLLGELKVGQGSAKLLAFLGVGEGLIEAA